MADIRTRVQGIDPNCSARDVKAMAELTGNIYETLSIITKRAKQLQNDIKKELKDKLDDFAVTTDNIEEIHENKEQIEISKFYEKLPNSPLIATDEMLKGELTYRYADTEEEN